MCCTRSASTRTTTRATTRRVQHSGEVRRCPPAGRIHAHARIPCSTNRKLNKNNDNGSCARSNGASCRIQCRLCKCCTLADNTHSHRSRLQAVGLIGHLSSLVQTRGSWSMNSAFSCSCKCDGNEQLGSPSKLLQKGRTRCKERFRHSRWCTKTQ